MDRSTELRAGDEIERGPSSPRAPLAWIGVFLRGMAMGVAELVPGVSGGTIAFITGIYMELVQAIRGLTPSLALQAFRGEFLAAWHRGNLGFLAVLAAGMAVSVFGFASVVAWLLENREIHLWSFFFGLIVASVVTELRWRLLGLTF